MLLLSRVVLAPRGPAFALMILTGSQLRNCVANRAVAQTCEFQLQCPATPQLVACTIFEPVQLMHFVRRRR